MRRGRIGYAAWLLAVACLYFFENNAGTRAVLAMSVCLPALSIRCAALAARRAGCALELPAEAVRGGTARAVCRLTGSRLLAGCAFTGSLAIENPLTGEQWEKSFRAAGGAARFALTAAHCGQLCVRTKGAAIQDWFGLARFPVAEAEASALVAPDLKPAAMPRPDADGPGGAPAADAGAEPDGDVRGYVPGDPVRLIHWKLSAKLDELLVREAAGAGGRGLFLMLETVRSGASPRAMDAPATTFLAASRELAARGVPHSACWFEHGRGALRWVAVDGPADFDGMMAEALRAASVEDGEDVARRFDEIYPRVRPGQTLLFSPRDWEGKAEEAET